MKIQKKIKTSVSYVKDEMRKSASVAIVSALGFIVALSWRDVIKEYTDKITMISPVKGNIVSAIIVTFLSVVGIVVVSNILANKEKLK